MNTHIELYNHIKMPLQGIGTYGYQSEEETYQSVLYALKKGIRLIDTSVMYHNESAIKRAIKDAGVLREDLFITGKLPPHIKRGKSVKRFFEKSLENLGIDYFDAYIINAPGPFNDLYGDYDKENVDVYKALETLYKEEKVASIGVSRFQIKDLKNILNHCHIKPHINQIAFFVGHTQDELVRYCKENNIQLQAFSPFARGELFKNKTLVEIGKKYNKTPAQIALKYIIDNGLAPIPKATSNQHIDELTSLDFILKKDDIASLDQINEDVRTYQNK